jgi:serine protease Do
MVKFIFNTARSSLMGMVVLCGPISAGALSAAALPPPVILTSQVNIGRIAQNVTVLIRGADNTFCSGVIVARSGKIYTVLTVSYLLLNSERYTISAPDGIKYPLKNAQKLPGNDMATVQFESSATYAIAKLGNSDKLDFNSSAYVAGYPKPGSRMNIDPVLTITNGNFSPLVPEEQVRDGYTIAYDSPTRAGMGGGPVFNDAGEVIAIHGRKSVQSVQSVQSGKTPADEKWLNVGMPINRYKAAIEPHR